MERDAPPVKISAEDEGLCMDCFMTQDDRNNEPSRRFCRLFKVCQNVMSVGRVYSAHESSPSKRFQVNPKLNCSFAAGSVFRILRLNGSEPYEFGTGWMAAPGETLTEGRIAYYFVSAYHLFKDWKEASFYGCFGEGAKKPSYFRAHGFEIKFSDPLFYTKQTEEAEKAEKAEEAEEADLCVIKFSLSLEDAKASIPEGVSYLLPCTSDDSALENGLASYGFPGVKAFLVNAERQLEFNQKEDDKELSLWDRYQVCFSTKRELMNAIKAALRDLKTGFLCCSPATFRRMSGSFLHFDSSTVPGCSGSPVMTNSFEGYAVGTLKGSVGVGFDVRNRATCHDFPGFVEFYGKKILPMIPHRIHRDAAPFIKWISKHNLHWPMAMLESDSTTSESTPESKHRPMTMPESDSTMPESKHRPMTMPESDYARQPSLAYDSDSTTRQSPVFSVAL